MRRARLVAGLAAVALAAPQAALAHQGNPNMTSVVRSIVPAVSGVRVDVLGGGDELEMRNTSGREIVVYGYQGERYARLSPAGVVELNRNSPAYYLNQDYYGAVDVPANAKASAAPDWTVVSRDGRLRWHDHRSHWMGRGTPPGIADESRRQKYSDFAVPISIGGRRGAIRGTIWWAPVGGGGPPVAAIVALVLILAGGIGAVLVVRRRRSRTGAGVEREAW